MRPLRTCEVKGTIIRHKEVDSVMRIAGSYKGGFLVADLEYKMPFPVQLPFRNISQWEVLKEG